MAKAVTITIKQNDKVKEIIQRPLIRGYICYDGQMHQVVDNVVVLPLDDTPEPGDPPIPIESDPEFARLLGWFCQNGKQIRETLGLQALYVTEDGTIDIPFFRETGTIRR